MTEIADAFAEYHALNPHVYEAVKRFALEAIASGRERLGIAAIIERVRWHYMIEVNRTDAFKINNNHRAFYVRLFESEYPQHRGFFVTRKSIADLGDQDAEETDEQESEEGQDGEGHERVRRREAALGLEEGPQG